MTFERVRDYDAPVRVAVAGGGIFGQIIAWRAALRGHHVTVVEPRGPGNAASASGDRTRLVRALYDEPCFTEAGHRSLALWSQWSRELSAELVVKTGVLYLDRGTSSDAAAAFHAWLDKGIANVCAIGATVEVLAPREASSRWPALSPSGLMRVVFEPGGGIGRASLATRTIARAGLATGHVTHVPAEVKRIVVSGGAARGVEVCEPGDGELATEIGADVIIVAAGFAGAALIEPFSGDLGVRRLPHWTSYWDVPWPEGQRLSIGALPAWADLGAMIYGFPDDGESGFKMAWHAPRAEAEAEGPPPPEQLEALRDAAAQRFPALQKASFRGHYACAYDATPDEMFRVGPVPGVDGLFFVGGLSGHGYKHAPAIGEAVAAMATGDAPSLDLSKYALPKASPA